MTIRTDNYPIAAPAPLQARMACCNQVGPRAAREALSRGLLVFGLCPDMKWRQVERVTVHKPGPAAPTFYRVIFKDPKGYMRTFTKNGILLVEVSSEPTD